MQTCVKVSLKSTLGINLLIDEESASSISLDNPRLHYKVIISYLFPNNYIKYPFI